MFDIDNDELAAIQGMVEKTYQVKVEGEVSNLDLIDY